MVTVLRMFLLVYSLHYVKLTSVAYLKADSAMLSISSSSFIMSLAQW